MNQTVCTPKSVTSLCLNALLNFRISHLIYFYFQDSLYGTLNMICSVTNSNCLAEYEVLTQHYFVIPCKFIGGFTVNVALTVNYQVIFHPNFDYP